MITDKVMEWFAAAVRWLLSAFPEWSLPDVSDELETLFDNIWPHMAWASWLDLYLPVTEALALTSLGLVLWLALHVIQTTSWVLTKLHITGGSS